MAISRSQEFIGRDEQIEELKALWKGRKRSALVTCVGRRRIGKSRLIEHFAELHADRFLEFQGIAPRDGQENRDQLQAFGERLAEYMKLSTPLVLGSWTQAFEMLDLLIRDDERTVILLDEISWMGRHDRDFPGRVKEAWDTRFSKHPSVILVLCGSVSTWIERNLIRHTGFLDRITRRFELRELSLSESNRLAWNGAKQVSDLEKLRILSVTGGVPRYLEEIDPKQSAEQNIKRLCFQPGGALFRPGGRIDEFDSIFSHVFDRRAEAYGEVVKQLASGSKTLSELAKGMNKTRAGYFSEYLEDLQMAGFIREEPHFQIGVGEGKIAHYRLSDNYLRFHLKYIAPHWRKIQDRRYRWSGLEDLPAWRSILGFQFENLVLNNETAILDRLGVEEVRNIGPYYQSATKRRRGCQVDLLIETAHSLFVCEIKFREVIGTDVIDEVQNKIERFSLPRKKKHLNRFPVLIHAGALEESLARSDYFHSVIAFGELLESDR